MFARRFFIVCLLCSILGSTISIVVVETARPARSWDAISVPACMSDAAGRCARGYTAR